MEALLRQSVSLTDYARFSSGQAAGEDLFTMNNQAIWTWMTTRGMPAIMLGDIFALDMAAAAG
jgi:hypothetical protein